MYIGGKLSPIFPIDKFKAMYISENIHTHPKEGHWKFRVGRGLG